MRRFRSKRSSDGTVAGAEPKAQLEFAVESCASTKPCSFQPGSSSGDDGGSELLISLDLAACARSAVRLKRADEDLDDAAHFLPRRPNRSAGRAAGRPPDAMPARVRVRPLTGPGDAAEGSDWQKPPASGSKRRHGEHRRPWMDTNKKEFS
ncbi:unnamed protein product [Lampetra fluviatilis]